MAIAVWSYGNVRILALSDNVTTEGGILPRPRSICGLRGLDGLGQALTVVLAHGRRAILLDMEKVTFINALDLGELIACHKLARQQGSTLALLRPTCQVRGVIQMTHLDTTFRMFDDEATALAALGGRPPGPRPGQPSRGKG
jgi:anti-anti-sigma factor